MNEFIFKDDMSAWLNTHPDKTALREKYLKFERLFKDARKDAGVVLRLCASKELLLQALSERLPRKSVRLDRIRPFDEHGIDAKYVEHLKDHRTFDEHPIIVRGRLGSGPLILTDGRHRVLAARECGEPVLLAVSATPILDDEQETLVAVPI